MSMRWTVAAVFLLLTAPAESRAHQLNYPLGPLPVFEEDLDSGDVFELELGTYELNLSYDPTVNSTGGIYGFGSLMLVGFGGVAPTEFTCLAAGCTFNSLPTKLYPEIGPGFIMVGGDTGHGDFSVQQLGVLILEVTGPGLFAVLGGRFFDADFGKRHVEPSYIAAFGVDPIPGFVPHDPPTPHPDDHYWGGPGRPQIFFPNGFENHPGVGAHQTPEPSGGLLLGLGIVGVILLRRVRGKNGAGARR